MSSYCQPAPVEEGDEEDGGDPPLVPGEEADLNGWWDGGMFLDVPFPEAERDDHGDRYREHRWNV